MLLSESLKCLENPPPFLPSSCDLRQIHESAVLYSTITGNEKYYFRELGNIILKIPFSTTVHSPRSTQFLFLDKACHAPHFKYLRNLSLSLSHCIWQLQYSIAPKIDQNTQGFFTYSRKDIGKAPWYSIVYTLPISQCSYSIPSQNTIFTSPPHTSDIGMYFSRSRG
jgi:hypothetical protein